MCEFGVLGTDQTNPAVTPVASVKIAASNGNFLVAFGNQRRVYDKFGAPISGSEFDPLQPLAQEATSTFSPVEVMFGAQDGFLASVWGASAMRLRQNYLVRLNAYGQELVSSPTSDTVGGMAVVGAKASDGDWVATTVSDRVQKVGRYYLGQVDGAAQIIDLTTRQYNFDLPNTSCNNVSGISRINGTIALGGTWFDEAAETSNVGVVLANPYTSPIVMNLTDPVTASTMSGCPANFWVLKTFSVGGFFNALWQDNQTGAKFLSHFSQGGTYLTTMPAKVDNGEITDILSIKGGYAMATYDASSQLVGLVITDETLVVKYSRYFVGRLGASKELPIIAMDVATGHFGLAWMDGSGVGQVVLLGLECQESIG
jgi:hypothetical protein